jgi:hypothetical protein
MYSMGKIKTHDYTKHLAPKAGISLLHEPPKYQWWAEPFLQWAVIVRVRQLFTGPIAIPLERQALYLEWREPKF